MSDLLTAATVVAYVQERLRGVPDLPLNLTAPLQAREIAGGNLNYAFHVHEVGSPGKAVFVKQAPGFIKCLGPEFELSARRAVFESEVMREYQKLAPEHSPRHLLLDEARCVMVLQYLDGYVLLRDALLAGSVSARVAADLGTFMGETHRRTHAALLAEWESGTLAQRFQNETMCGITAEYVFTKPLLADDPTNRCSAALAPYARAMRADAELSAAMLELRTAFCTRRECLVHGDLHTGSVMVPAAAASDAPAVVIDAEFAFYGPAAFDVGVLLANLLFAALAHAMRPTVQAALLAAVDGCWRAYVAVLARPAPPAAEPCALGAPEAARALLRESAGFCGCELVRRVLGAAHVDDLETIADAEAKLRAERIALELGGALLKRHRSLEGVEDLLGALQAAVLRVGDDAPVGDGRPPAPAPPASAAIPTAKPAAGITVDDESDVFEEPQD